MKREIAGLIIFSGILIFCLILLLWLGPITDPLIVPLAVGSFLVPIGGIVAILYSLYRKSRSNYDSEKHKSAE